MQQEDDIYITDIFFEKISQRECSLTLEGIKEENINVNEIE